MSGARAYMGLHFLVWMLSCLRLPAAQTHHAVTANSDLQQFQIDDEQNLEVLYPIGTKGGYRKNTDVPFPFARWAADCDVAAYNDDGGAYGVMYHGPHMGGSFGYTPTFIAGLHEEFNPLLKKTVVNLYMCFRGTEFASSQWFRHAKHHRIHMPGLPGYFTTPPDCKVHQGFWEMYSTAKHRESMRIQALEAIKANLSAMTGSVVFTGHSLGGALATYAAMDFMYAGQFAPYRKRVYLVTFASPRPGSGKFRKSLIKHLNSRQIAPFYNGYDVVPLLPSKWINGYEHVVRKHWVWVNPPGWKEWLKFINKVDQCIGENDLWGFTMYVKEAVIKWHSMENYIQGMMKLDPKKLGLLSDDIICDISCDNCEDDSRPAFMEPSVYCPLLANPFNECAPPELVCPDEILAWNDSWCEPNFVNCEIPDWVDLNINLTIPCMDAGANCTDGILNGFETDVDCGGVTCPVCTHPGQMCNDNYDCGDGLVCRDDTETCFDPCEWDKQGVDVWRVVFWVSVTANGILLILVIVLIVLCCRKRSSLSSRDDYQKPADSDL